MESISLTRTAIFAELFFFHITLSLSLLSICILKSYRFHFDYKRVTESTSRETKAEAFSFFHFRLHFNIVILIIAVCRVVGHVFFSPLYPLLCSLCFLDLVRQNAHFARVRPLICSVWMWKCLSCKKTKNIHNELFYFPIYRNFHLCIVLFSRFSVCVAIMFVPPFRYYSQLGNCKLVCCAAIIW